MFIITNRNIGPKIYADPPKRKMTKCCKRRLSSKNVIFAVNNFNLTKSNFWERNKVVVLFWSSAAASTDWSDVIRPPPSNGSAGALEAKASVRSSGLANLFFSSITGNVYVRFLHYNGIKNGYTYSIVSKLPKRDAQVRTQIVYRCRG